MNWLAHVFLSEAAVEVRLGNLLADLVRGEQRDAMSALFLRGVRCHRAIDSFTDAHALVRRSRARIDAPLRRFSGVLVDVFYDYFLAKDWHRYAAQPLEAFTREFYAEAEPWIPRLPEPARVTLARIMRHDLLGAYREVGGVERSLRRLSAGLEARWHRPFALEQGVLDLVQHEDQFAEDFAEFFPSLQTHVAHVIDKEFRNANL